FSLHLLPPLHATSSLFPYTTLFRSVFDGLDLELLAVLSRQQSLVRWAERHHLPLTATAVVQVLKLERAVGLAILAGLLEDFANLDRKSTRLNSSHQIISYAVFCLKK